jgi:hypothetical protein
MTTTTVAKRKTASEQTRRLALARKGDPRTLSESEVNRYCDIWRKYGQKPQRLEVLRRLIQEAWNLACYLRQAGLKLQSSSLDQAALTIAGCAYAEWMTTVVVNPAEHPAPGDPARITDGFSTGIQWALWMGDGMPSLQADSFTCLAERSDSDIDRMIPLEVVAKLWPDMVKDGKLDLPIVGVKPLDPDAWDAWIWEPRPNILTAPLEDVKAEERRSRLRDDRRQKKAMTKKRSKAKSRAK